ncbi:recombination-associated protein RdgC [Rhodoferax sp. BLA1]|uniref:recombination-associated protein RdgC n=1 Tax=Rhodoferax sp. BLA1 TaxID=2576062 RepID=UPI0015D2146F|nr:recombination-associated protein RdgC [Rhodoferax sp. BLA1]
MFTNAVIYRITVENFFTPGTWLDDAIASQAFVPTGPTQERSFGFVPPRGHAHDAMVESIGGQLILKHMTESRSVPARAIANHVDEMVQKILEATGRNPGKKEIRDLKDESRLTLLPSAFPKQEAVFIWIDPVAARLVIGASSQAKADKVVNSLVQAIKGLAVTLVNTQVSPVAAMAEWLLSGDAPAGFTVDRDCELKSADESKAVVRYARHRLDTDEVRDHIRAGLMPTRLALTWSDRVSFVLTDGLQIRKISFLDVVFADTLDRADDEAHAFDTDAAIATGELLKLIPDLLSALSGELEA